MAKKPSKRNSIHGDVNITNGDFVAGDKTITHTGGEQNLAFEKPSQKKRATPPKSRDVNGNLDFSGGDVVFGNKIIKFFQDSLNIYLFRDLRQLIVFLAFVLLVFGTIGGAYWYSIQPKKMTGHYNIAIAQFGEIRENGKIRPSKVSEQVRTKLFGNLQSEYEQSIFGLAVKVESKNMPLITTDSEAEELAKKVNADIVIYGVVVVQQNQEQASLQPRFYVREQPDTNEITGTNELAVPIAFALSELDTSVGINAQLLPRAEILFNFTKALILFSQKDYDSALRSAKSAIFTAEHLPEPFDGQEVLYLLAGKIHRRQQDFEHANEMLDQALRLNPDYARAHLGRGNIFYQQGKIIWEAGKPPTYNRELLLQAKTEYELALEAADQPEGAYIQVKAYTGLGNVFLNIAQMEPRDTNLFPQAIDYYAYVVNEYQRTKDPILQPYAAISYYGLGGAYHKQEKLDQALEAYRLAYELEDDPADKGLIQAAMDQVQNTITASTNK